MPTRDPDLVPDSHSDPSVRWLEAAPSSNAAATRRLRDQQIARGVGRQAAAAEKAKRDSVECKTPSIDTDNTTEPSETGIGTKYEHRLRVIRRAYEKSGGPRPSLSGEYKVTLDEFAIKRIAQDPGAPLEIWMRTKGSKFDGSRAGISRARARAIKAYAMAKVNAETVRRYNGTGITEEQRRQVFWVEEETRLHFEQHRELHAVIVSLLDKRRSHRHRLSQSQGRARGNEPGSSRSVGRSRESRAGSHSSSRPSSKSSDSGGESDLSDGDRPGALAARHPTSRKAPYAVTAVPGVKPRSVRLKTGSLPVRRVCREPRCQARVFTSRAAYQVHLSPSGACRIPEATPSLTRVIGVLSKNGQERHVPAWETLSELVDKRGEDGQRFLHGSPVGGWSE